MSRHNASDHNDGYTAAEAILRLAQGVDSTLATLWRSAVAGWPQRDTYGNMLSGATIPRVSLVARPPTATWVGGSTLDGYAAIGQDLEGPVSPLKARKSWFCLDEYVVALGAGITGSSGHPVETIVENRNLHSAGTNALTVDGITRVPELGNATSVTNLAGLISKASAAMCSPAARTCSSGGRPGPALGETSTPAVRRRRSPAAT